MLSACMGNLADEAGFVRFKKTSYAKMCQNTFIL